MAESGDVSMAIGFNSNGNSGSDGEKREIGSRMKREGGRVGERETEKRGRSH